MQELFSPNAKLSADHQLMTSALVERGGRSDRRHTALCQSLSATFSRYFGLLWSCEVHNRVIKIDAQHFSKTILQHLQYSEVRNFPIYQILPFSLFKCENMIWTLMKESNRTSLNKFESNESKIICSSELPFKYIWRM